MVEYFAGDPASLSVNSETSPAGRFPVSAMVNVNYQLIVTDIALY